MQQRQPFGNSVSNDIVDARRIAARTGLALDQAKLHRVVAGNKHDRDRRGRSFGGDRDSRRPGYCDSGHAAADKVGHQRRHAIIAALEPMTLDAHISAFDIAGLAEAFVEGAHVVCEPIRRCEADQTDYRQRALLRRRGGRPRRRPPKCRDEFPSSHL
jgi:hypothetical protein